MKIAVDFGHGVQYDRGAEGILNEENVIREYGPIVISKLQALEYEVLNVTPSSATSLGDSLEQRATASNNFGADLFVSCHVNSFEDPKAHGCEVEYVSSKGKEYAERVCNAIAELGYTNREPNYRANLYVLNHTIAVAILIEPFFCGNEADCSGYNAETLATAIVKGITGQQIIFQGDEDVKALQGALNAQGYRDESGNELDEDGLIGIHTLRAASKCLVKFRANGEITRFIQKTLIKLGFSCGSYGADGDFGNCTLAAVQSFQASHGLSVDGEVGPFTWGELLGLIK